MLHICIFIFLYGRRKLAYSFAVGISVTEGVSFSPETSYYHGLLTNEYNKGINPTGADFTNRNLGLSLGFSLNPGAMKSWKSKAHNR